MKTKRNFLLGLFLIIPTFISPGIHGHFNARELTSISVSLMMYYEPTTSVPCTINDVYLWLNIYGPSTYVSYCVTQIQGATVNYQCLDADGNGDIIERNTLHVTSSDGISFRVTAYNVYNQISDQSDFSYIDCSDFY